MREALRALLFANNAGDRPPAGRSRRSTSSRPRPRSGCASTPAGAQLVSTCGGVDSAIAQLLAIVHESMRDGTWLRLKACPADDCHWAFYDHSRNRSGTWCEMSECGNRAKARAYRERHRARGQAIASGGMVVDTELWGGETAKAVENFPVSGHPIPAPVVHWLGRIKAAAARVNAELGELDGESPSGSPRPATRSPPASTTTSSRSTSSRPAPAPRRT